MLLGMMLSSCGTLQVFVSNDTGFSRKTPITITNQPDPSGTVGILQFLLQTNGYKVISMDVAKKALNIDSNNSSHTEITSTIDFKTAYVLTMDYTYYVDPIVSTNCGYHYFYATIVDLRSGELILTATFRGDRQIDEVLEMFIKELNRINK